VIERELSQRVEALGSRVQLDDLRIDWLGPGLAFEGLRIETNGHEHLHLDHVYVAAGLDEEGELRLERVDVDGGRLAVSEAAVEELRALMQTTEASVAGVELPSVQVRDLAVDFEIPGRGPTRLGRLDLSMRAEARAPSRITGRVRLPTRPDSARRETAVFLNGLVGLDGQVELHALSDGLAIETLQPPTLAGLEIFQELEPRGRVSLHASGSLSLKDELEPRGELRLRLEEGGLVLPWLAEPLTDGRVELEASYRPEMDQDFWSPAAWAGSGRLAARLEAQELRAGLRLGRSARPGLAFELFFRAPDLDVKTRSIAGLEAPELVPILYGAVDPGGRADARFALTCDESARPDEPLWPAVELAVSVRGLGELSAAYHGWPDERRPGVEPLGFPMPAVAEHARVVFAHTKRFPRRNRLDVRFAGRHATGPFRGSYQMWSNPVDMPPFAPGYGLVESDLFIDVPHIGIDAELRRHLPELWEIPELVTLFDDYGLREEGGARVKIRVCGRASTPRPSVRVEVDGEGLAAAWSELPVPARELDARVVVVADGERSSSVSFRVDGLTESARSLRVAGRVRGEAAEDGTPMPSPRFDWVAVDVQGFDLDGPGAARVGGLRPDVGLALAELAPAGPCDVSVTRSSRRGRPERMWIELAPRPGRVQLLPRAFPMLATDLRGRAIVDVEATSETERKVDVRLAPLAARWRGSIPIAMAVELRDGQDSTGTLRGAGLYPSDRELLADLAAAQGADPEHLLREAEAFHAGGAIDFEYSFRLPPIPARLDDRVRFRLRGNDLVGRDGLRVDGLQGTFELHDGHLRSPELVARVGSSRIDLREVEVRLEGEEVHADGELAARGLTIDRELLLQFLEPSTVELLVEEGELRGEMDLDRCRLHLVLHPERPPLLSLRGQGTLSDAYLSAELPISVRSARLELEELVLEGDEVRGWGRIEDLYGEVAERDLAQTSLLVSYHGTQVTVGAVDGLFCRGRLRGIGADERSVVAEPVLSIDLEPPFRFQAGVAVSNLDVGLLLEDVFASEIAARGFLSGNLRLRGELDDLFGVRGTGFGRVTDTVLWSVPVVRDLFGQLGLDETAVFDEVESRVEVADGRIWMEAMRVHSPLLNLRGSGSLGFDGTLDHELEITYSLVDKIGPFSALIYWLQNNLLKIRIRGDMARPKIIPRGVFSNPFVDVDDPWRALPAPGFSELPERF